jgi:hypothetical protein
MATTYFKADLRCSNCGQTNTAWLASHLDDQGDNYEVGDRYDDRISIADFDVSCLTVRPPETGDAIHAVESWTCTNCNAANFGEIVFAGGVVTSIEAIELDLEALERVHFLGEETVEMLQAIAGEPLRVGGKRVSNWLALLRAGLAAGRRW